MTHTMREVFCRRCFQEVCHGKKKQISQMPGRNISGGHFAFFGFFLLLYGAGHSDKLSIVLDQEETVRIPLPVRMTLESESEEVVLGSGSEIPTDQITIVRDQAFRLYGKTEGSYQLNLDLFGWLRFKEIQVDVVDTQYAVPCGVPVGIYLESDGVMVIGTGELTNEKGQVVEPAAGILRSGDYIEAINGQPLETKEELAEAVGSAGGPGSGADGAPGWQRL